MAEKRMFSKTIIDSDVFLDMSLSTQALYFHLSMRADDDGFINNPRKIQRMVGANDDDLKVLIAKKFILPFESGIVVIKHWKIHNYIQKDRYKETAYIEEKSMLVTKENKAYSFVDTECIQSVSSMDTQSSIDKNRLEEISNTTVEQETRPDDAIISIRLQDNTMFDISRVGYEEYVKSYVDVNVMQQLRDMKMWCEANASKRKTRKGAPRFIVGWLNKEQQRISDLKISKQIKPKSTPQNFTGRQYDATNLEMGIYSGQRNV